MEVENESFFQNIKFKTKEKK